MLSWLASWLRKEQFPSSVIKDFDIGAPRQHKPGPEQPRSLQSRQRANVTSLWGLRRSRPSRTAVAEIEAWVSSTRLLPTHHPTAMDLLRAYYSDQELTGVIGGPSLRIDLAPTVREVQLDESQNGTYRQHSELMLPSTPDLHGSGQDPPRRLGPSGKAD